MSSTPELRINRPQRLPELLSALIAAIVIWPSPVSAEDRSEAIGLVRLNLPAGLSILSMPFTEGDNSLNTILRLPESAMGSTIYRFDETNGAYGEPILFAGAAAGWLSFNSDTNWLIIKPGEAFFFEAPEPMVLSLVGAVPQGQQRVGIPGNGALSLKSSPVPQVAPIGDLLSEVGLFFPALHGDQLFIFDSSIQNYKQRYNYIDGSGWRSTNPDDPGLLGPTLGLASGFFLYRTQANQDWQRNFDVNSDLP